MRIKSHGVVALALATGALTLAACNKAENTAGTDATKSGGAGTVDEIKPRPGLYRATLTVDQLEMPGAPAETVNLMRRGMTESAARDPNLCITPEEAQKTNRERIAEFGTTEGSGCTVDRYTSSGSRFDSALTCGPANGPEDAKIRMTYGGTMTAESADITFTTVGRAAGPALPSINMRARYHTQWIGECSPAQLAAARAETAKRERARARTQTAPAAK